MTAVPTLAAIDDEARSILFTEARTANSFAPTPVSDAQLSSIWDLARWPPTSANMQPLRVLYVRTDRGRDRLLMHMSEGNVAKTRSAPAVAVLAVDTDFHEYLPALVPFRPELRDALAVNTSARESIGSFNGALQAGYFLMAVRAVGLAAGPMGGFDKAGLDADFFSDGRWKSILVVNIGHPGADPWFDRLPRLGTEDAVSWA